jgi:hypothetical protein
LYITIQKYNFKTNKQKITLKLQITTPKQSGIYREHLLQTGTVFSRISGRENSGGASSHSPPPLVAREPTRHRKQLDQRDRGQPLLPFLFLPAVTTTVICKKKENASKVSVLPPLLDLLSFLLLLVFCSSLLQVADGSEVRVSL